MRLSKVITVISWLTASVAPGQPTWPEPLIHDGVWGTVCDEEMRPLAGARVAFHSAMHGYFTPVRTTVTNAEGRYSFENVTHLSSEEALSVSEVWRMRDVRRVIVSAAAEGRCRQWALTTLMDEAGAQIDFALPAAERREGGAVWYQGREVNPISAAGLDVAVSDQDLIYSHSQGIPGRRVTISSGTTSEKGTFSLLGVSDDYPDIAYLLNGFFVSESGDQVVHSFGVFGLVNEIRKQQRRLAQLDTHMVSLRGVVQGGATGQPLAGTEVWLGNRLCGWRLLTAVTDAEGRFEFTGLPRGPFQLTVPAGLFTEAVPIEHTGEYPERVLRVAEPLPVAGTLYHINGSAPIPNIPLRIWSAHERHAQECITDAEGRFTCPELLLRAGQPGHPDVNNTSIAFCVEPLDPEWVNNSGAVAEGPVAAQNLRVGVVTDEVSRPIPVPPLRGVEMHLALVDLPPEPVFVPPSGSSARARFRGRVMDPQGRGIAGATVSWDVGNGGPRGEAQTSGDGRFDFEAPADALFFTASGPGYIEASQVVRETDPESMEFRLAPTLIVRWTPAASDGPYDVPQIRAVAWSALLGNERGKQEIDGFIQGDWEDRWFAINHQLGARNFPGTLRLILSSQREGTAQVAVRDVTVSSEPSQEFDLGLIEWGTLAPLEGEVVDQGGAPVPGAVVTLADKPDSRVEADAQGRFRFADLVPASHRLIAFKRGEMAVEVEATVPQEEPLRIRLAPEDGVRVAVRLNLPPGFRLLGASLEDLRPGVEIHSAPRLPLQGPDAIMDNVPLGPKRLHIDARIPQEEEERERMLRDTGVTIRSELEVTGPMELEYDLSRWVTVTGELTTPESAPPDFAWPSYSGWLRFIDPTRDLTATTHIHRNEFMIRMPAGTYAFNTNGGVLGRETFETDTHLTLDGTCVMEELAEEAARGQR